MPLFAIVIMIVAVIAASALTIWLGYSAGFMAAGPVLIGLLALRVWMERK